MMAAKAPYTATMTFDVASVREGKVDPLAGITMSGQFAPNSTVLRVSNWGIESLLSYAYGIEHFQVVGLPNWPWTTVFVIDARGDSDADAKMSTLNVDQQRMERQHMLQILLADRFKLRAHWETKAGDAYTLVVTKGGPRLGPEGSVPPTEEERNTFGAASIPAIHQTNYGRGYAFISHGGSMNELAANLAAQFSRPVSDETGLTGKYDFVLRYEGRWGRDRMADDMDSLPTLDRALQDQLGLRLEASKAPARVLAIDHVEKPSEN